MPTYQDWGPLPFQKTTTKSINITGAVPGYTETLNIKDVVDLYPQYSQFRLVVIKQYVNPSYPDFIVPFAFSGIDDTDVFPPNASYKKFQISENGITLTFPIEFQNIGLLSPNTYRFKQTFALSGLNSSTIWKEISYIEHETILNIIDKLVIVTPSNITINHIIGTSLKTEEITVNGNEWVVVGNPKFKLSSLNPNVIINQLTGPAGVYQTASGLGTAVVKITLTTFFNIVGTEPYPFSYDVLDVMSGGQKAGSFAVRVKKFGTQVLTLSPEELHFFASKNTTDAASQNLVFECNAAYTISCSTWLTTAVDDILNDGVPQQVIVVQPISSYNQEAGIYTGFVTVTAVISGVETSVTTIVHYEISDIAAYPYTTNELAFTLDNKFIKLETFNTDTYMQMEAVIKAFDFYTDEVNEHIIREKIGLFNGKAKVNIGKTIHQILGKEKEVNENNLQYLPALVQVIFYENNLSDNATIRIDGSGDLRFIAGLSNGFKKFGFLKLNKLSERVTINSFKYLNYFIPAGDYKLVIFKNGSIYSQEILPPSMGKIATLKVTFEQFAQGDKIEYVIDPPFTGRQEQRPFKVSYIIFPEGKYSNSLTWEDEFLLKQSVECTGVFNVKSTLSFISQKKYVNLVEQLGHLETSKVAKISINTGWLLNTDVDMIESLMRSKKVWMEAKRKTIFLIPLSDSITNTDSERELIDYTLEFQINPSYNEETYML